MLGPSLYEALLPWNAKVDIGALAQ